MIQQLFPGRTRNQVKLKYKKEERQHPMRLREALTNRAKGPFMCYLYLCLRDFTSKMSLFCVLIFFVFQMSLMRVIYLADHSHFEKVIEHLQQIAAEEKQNSNKDDSIDLTGNEDAEEGSHEANVSTFLMHCFLMLFHLKSCAIYFYTAQVCGKSVFSNFHVKNLYFSGLCTCCVLLSCSCQF